MNEFKKKNPLAIKAKSLRLCVCILTAYNRGIDNGSLNEL